MGALDQADSHLAKAAEFLASAETELAFERHDAATSSAATSGINSKDAICLKLTGRTNKTENHCTAVGELQRAGRWRVRSPYRRPQEVVEA